MIRIHKQFLGGNIRLIHHEDRDYFLENELRDTTSDWFYFAFCVEGAGGKELTFHMQKNRLGPWGPAVSHDLVHWHWLGSCSDDSFTYRFDENENEVYFAHHMLYHPRRMLRFAEKSEYVIGELCQSRKGRSVPFLTLGKGEKSILLTARHHACESTGSYVLEGVLRTLARILPEDYRIFCVPFVDYDGVVDGDQGKGRAPHDHNRDYGEEHLYPEVAAICKYRETHTAVLGFDFHSPWHRGGENDTVFIVRNLAQKERLADAFSALLASRITKNSMHYQERNDHPAGVGWNTGCAPNFARTTCLCHDCLLALTLETAYFGTENDRTSEDRLLALGEAFALAIVDFTKAHA